MHEAEIETTPEGKVPVGGGWFVLNLGEMAWETVPGFGVWRGFDAPVGLLPLPSRHGARHGWRRRRAVRDPHVRKPDPSRNIDWIADETAAKHGASVAQTTGRSIEAYGEQPEPVRAPAPSPLGGPPPQ